MGGASIGGKGVISTPTPSQGVTFVIPVFEYYGRISTPTPSQGVTGFLPFLVSSVIFLLPRPRKA